MSCDVVFKIEKLRAQFILIKWIIFENLRKIWIFNPIQHTLKSMRKLCRKWTNNFTYINRIKHANDRNVQHNLILFNSSYVQQTRISFKILVANSVVNSNSKMTLVYLNLKKIQLWRWLLQQFIFTYYYFLYLRLKHKH